MLHLVPEEEDRPKRAIEIAEAWIRGEAGEADCSRTAEEAEEASHALDVDEPLHAWAAHAAAHPGEAVAHPLADAAHFVAEAARIAGETMMSLTHERSAAPKHLAALLGLVSTERWPLTIPTPEQRAVAHGAVQVAWDFVSTDDRTDHTMTALIEAHTRAARLSLEWSDPVQRAIAERTTDEGSVQRLLRSEDG